MHSCEIRILHMAGTGGCIKSTTITHLHGDFFVDEFCISRNHHFPMNIAVLAYSIVFPMFRHSQVSRVACRMAKDNRLVKFTGTTTAPPSTHLIPIVYHPYNVGAPELCECWFLNPMDTIVIGIIKQSY